MKNKRKSILSIFIIFFVILGLSYYTNAAENLKAAQDKYRISYNNFMKALKEGADQERIDQLSAQCKEDYAEYQKIVKGKNGSINKPSTPQTKPAGTTVPKIDSQSTNISIKQKIVTPQNKKSVKTTKPSQPIQVKLVRITDGNYSMGQVSDLPPGFSDIKDETLKQKVTAIRDKALNGEVPSIYMFCTYEYPNIPDLCGLVRLYSIQAKIKQESGWGYPVSIDTLRYIEEIKNFYENPKTKITEHIVAEIDKMIPKLNEYNDEKIKTAIKNAEKAMASYKNYTKNITDPGNKFTPSEVSEMKSGINSACLRVNSAYMELGMLYSTIGNHAGLKTLIDTYKNTFYDQIAANYNVNCIQQDSSVKPVKVSLDNKDSTIFFDLHDRYILTYLKHAETVDDGEAIFNKVTGATADGDIETDNIDKLLLRMQTPFQGDEGKNLVKETKLSDYQIDSYKDKMFSFKERPVIEKIYFTKYENITLSPSYENAGLPYSTNEIPKPNDVIAVRCQPVPNEDSYYDRFTCYYPIKLKIKSSVSNRERIIIVKKSPFSVYSKQIQLVTDPTSTDPEKCLIKPHGNGKDDFKHTFCLLDGAEQYLQENINSDGSFFKPIFESNFFKNKQLGAMLTRKRKDDPADSIVARKETFEAMGFETVTATNIGSDVVGFFNIKNQADWLIVDSHGNSNGDLLISMKGTSLKNAKVLPIDSLNSLTTRTSFVLFTACDILEIPDNPGETPSDINLIKESPGIKWRNKIGSNTAIMGYSDDNGTVFHTRIYKYLDDNISNIAYPYLDDFKVNICDEWINIHHKGYEEIAKKTFDVDTTNFTPKELFEYKEKIIKIEGIISSKAIFDEYYYSLVPIKSEDVMYNTSILHTGFNFKRSHIKRFLN